MATGFSIRRWLTSRRRGGRRRGLKCQARRTFELLESRTVLSLFTVNTLADTVAEDGAISLREAIQAANTNTAVFEAAAGEPGSDSLANPEDVIQFDPSLGGDNSTILLQLGQLTLADDVTIVGPSGGLAIHGGGDSRVFDVGEGVTAEISDLTITGGFEFLESGGVRNRGLLTLTNTHIVGNLGRSGGGIFNAGSLELIDTLVSGNDSAVSGGGIANSEGAVLILRNSGILNNTSAFGGGGILNLGDSEIVDSTIAGNHATSAIANAVDGTLVLRNSTLSGNSLRLSGAAISNLGSAQVIRSTIHGNHGGGIANSGTLVVSSSSISGNSGGTGVSNRGSLEIVDTTIHENRATSFSSGGGIFNRGTAIISRTTVSHNEAGASGGGILTSGDMLLTNSTISGNISRFGAGISNSGSLMLTNTTISNNLYSPGAQISDFDEVCLIEPLACVSFAGAGGGVHNTEAGILELSNSIIANNVAPDGPDLRNEGLIVLPRFNLIETPYRHDVAHDTLGNIVGLDPLLTELQDFGGPTRVHSPLPGSPVIDAGADALATGANGSPLTTDQRGFGFVRIDGLSVDIGSVELQTRTRDLLTDLRDGLSSLFEVGSLNEGQFISLSRRLTLKDNLGDLGRVFSFTRQIHAFSDARILSEKEAVPLLSNAQLLLTELAYEFGQQVDPIFDGQPSEPGDELGSQWYWTCWDNAMDPKL